jgi:glycosyltransferase involved in cell wall biosynthesis
MSAAPRRPTVSVVIPTFNRRRRLAETLASVRAQTFTDHEVVLVDDASTDGTAAWVRRAFPEVRVVRLARNMGPAAARNRGIDAARGPLIAFLDADDLWRADYLRALTPELLDPRIVVAFSSLDRIDARGSVTSLRAMRRGASGLSVWPVPSASIVRRSAVAAEGGFDPGFHRMFEDVDLFARLALRHGPAAFRLVDRGLVLYRSHEVQLTSMLQPSIVAWVRRSPAAAESDRGALLDLAYLDFKHRRWIAPMLASRSLNFSQSLSGGGYGVFELALSRVLSKPHTV